MVIGYPMGRRYNKDNGSIIYEPEDDPGNGIISFPDGPGGFDMVESYSLNREKNPLSLKDNGVDRTFWADDVQVSSGEEGATLRMSKGIVGLFSRQISLVDDAGKVSYHNQYIRITPSVKNSIDGYING